MIQFFTSLVVLDPDLVISYQLFTEMLYAYDINFSKINSENFHPINSSLSLKRILDSSYLLILTNVTFREYESNLFEPKNFKYETKNFDENILNYYSRKIKIIAMACDYLNMDLVL
tara:strand:- start:1007 stop:1354 length:348 start_codon:yes stop_codon:yes gene_type:complete